MYASGYVFVSQNGIDKQEYMSLVMRKPAFCICENKDADQLRGNREADQRLGHSKTNVHFMSLLSFEAKNKTVLSFKANCLFPTFN